MYFIACLCIFIIAGILNFLNNISTDWISGKISKDNGDKYYIDHNNIFRFTRTGKKVNFWTEQEERKRDISLFNKKSKNMAIQNRKTVYEYRDENYDKNLAKYVDLETNRIFEIRNFGYKQPFYHFYIDIKTGLYIRESDNTLSLPNTICLGYTREDAIRECKQHNEEVKRGICKDKYDIMKATDERVYFH